MLTSTIPANFSVEDVLRQIDNDPAPTEREKFLLQHFQETQDQLTEKDDEISRLDDRITELESSESLLANDLEETTCKFEEANLEIERLKELVADLEGRAEGGGPKVANAG